MAATIYGAATAGAGAIIKTYGQIKANMEQAAEERRNADWYRDQAEFTQQAGDRQRRIFERDTIKLQGEQIGQFAKAGIDASTGSASLFIAQEAVYRQEEDWAIKQETDMNVRLAMMRADQAQRTADGLSDFGNNAMLAAGNILGAAGSVL